MADSKDSHILYHKINIKKSSNAKNKRENTNHHTH
jgi:hypothetical protein